MWKWVFGSRYFFARPKSITLTWLPRFPIPMRKLSGLMSRWINDLAWMYSIREIWSRMLEGGSKYNTIGVNIPTDLPIAKQSWARICDCRSWTNPPNWGQGDQEPWRCSHTRFRTSERREFQHHQQEIYRLWPHTLVVGALPWRIRAWWQSLHQRWCSFLMIVSPVSSRHAEKMCHQLTKVNVPETTAPNLSTNTVLISNPQILMKPNCQNCSPI